MAGKKKHVGGQSGENKLSGLLGDWEGNSKDA